MKLVPKIPFLPFKTDYNTIVPIGEWTGWYFSEELKHAKTLGYKIVPLKEAYLFNKGKPFNKFIEHFSQTYMLPVQSNNLLK